MEIDINQKKISIGDKYQVFTGGKLTHTASRELFHLFPVVKLYEAGTGSLQATINKRFAWLKAKYDITRANGSVLEFRTVSFWKNQYQCRCGGDMYELYGHRGRKYSIFRNNVQVGWWDKKAVSWFAGDNYKITTDGHADADLLVTFCLIIDNFKSDDHDGNVVNYDLGNLFFEARKFDDTWQPRLRQP